MGHKTFLQLFQQHIHIGTDPGSLLRAHLIPQGPDILPALLFYAVHTIFHHIPGQ